MDENMLNIDKYAYSSKLKQQNPMRKLVFALLTMGVCIWADCIIVSIAILLIMSWVTVYKGGTPFNIFAKLMLIPMSFLFIGVFAIAFGISYNPSNLISGIHIWGMYIGISKAGAYMAIKLFFKALGAVSCLYYLSLSTPMVDMLSSLKKLRFNKLLIEMMSLIYRFIFVFLETANTMYIAQNSRLGYSDLRTGFRSMGSLASTLFIRAYRRADNLYTALEARGYDGELNVLEEPFESGIKDYIVPLFLNILLIIAALYFKQHTGGFFYE